jgi:hypothetical protein
VRDIVTSGMPVLVLLAALVVDVLWDWLKRDRR